MQSEPHQAPNTKGKNRQKQTATKWIDGKQSWQLFPKKVAALLHKFNWLYLKYILNLHNC